MTEFGEWVSVNDKLPDIETDVLCYNTIGTPPFVAGLFDGVWECFVDGGDTARRVDYWMPLPKLPSK